jgi:hypothetical protein
VPNGPESKEKTKMKIRNRNILMFFFGVGLCTCAAVFLSRPVNSEVSVVKDHAASGSKVIAGYKQWTLVNPQPKIIEAMNAGLCRAPLPIDIAHDIGSPHVRKLISVYVNEIGKGAMMEQKQPHFPEGSVIVKEKLGEAMKWENGVWRQQSPSPPELLTVMRKRETGYDPAKGDWEYLVFDGSGKTLQASGKLETCQACHSLLKNSDYIARSYLPAEVLAKLK